MLVKTSSKTVISITFLGVRKGGGGEASMMVLKRVTAHFPSGDVHCILHTLSIMYKVTLSMDCKSIKATRMSLFSLPLLAPADEVAGR